MTIRAYRAITVSLAFLILATIVHADSYSSFQTKRYYSANHQYFVKVTPNKRAALYRNDGKWQLVWSRTLPDLPARLFVANDGSRVVTIDYYYGNGGSASAKVVLFFNGSGRLIASHSLEEVANLSRVPQTTSSAHWYYGSLFTPDRGTLIVETIVRKCEPPKWIVQTREEVEALEECMKAQPYEELRFFMETGKLVSRADIQNKYIDAEIRLAHELELVENEHPPDKLSLVDALLRLASYYEGQRQYARAKKFYERAIPLYSKALGAGFFTVAEVVGKAATNYRNLGDYQRAEQLYRRALTSLDRLQGSPSNVSPIAITVYEEYASLLRMLNRSAEAERMEQRAKVLRATYPDYKVAKVGWFTLFRRSNG